jgi:hypothetical protein
MEGVRTLAAESLHTPTGASAGTLVVDLVGVGERRPAIPVGPGKLTVEQVVDDQRGDVYGIGRTAWQIDGIDADGILYPFGTGKAAGSPP